MLKFVRKFVLASGSLKEIPKEYGVSHPTIRLRLELFLRFGRENRNQAFLKKSSESILPVGRK